MTTMALQRINPLSIPKITEAKKIAEVTGYKGLGAITVFSDLIEIGVCPFDPNGVRLYKQKMRDDMNKDLNYRSWFRRRGFPMLCIIEAVFAVIWVAISYRKFFDVWGTAETTSTIAGSAFAWIVFASLLAGLFVLVTYDPMERPRWRWRERRLENYEKPVPLNVLRLAAEIESKVSEVTLYVESLENSRDFRPADPFLVVGCGNFRAHVAVWDEPTFSDVSMG